MRTYKFKNFIFVKLFWEGSEFVWFQSYFKEGFEFVNKFLNKKYLKVDFICQPNQI